MKLFVLLCCAVAALIWRTEGFPSGDPPMFTATLEDQVVPEMEANGDPASFSLQCQVTGDPIPTITWFRGGIKIEGETAATLTVDPIVAGTDATIAGVEYYCEANNSFGRIRSRRALVQLATFGAWNVSGTRTIDARSGFSVAIPCNPPPANPAPRVVWQADGVDIAAGDPLNGGDGERVQVLPSGHLVIHSLGASDFAVAQYRCSVRNVRTHSTSDSPQTFTLAEVSTLPATAGQTSLHVFNHEPMGQAERGKTFYIFNVLQPTEANDIFSNELPNIATTNQRDFYIINNVEVGDAVSLMVQYFEQVNTDAVNLGSLITDISVIDPARVTSVTGSQRVLTGRTVTLTCNITAIPNATAMWYKDGNLIPSGTTISTTPDTNTQLTIASATPADSGMYQCVVSNQHGDDVGSISLQVRDHQLELVQGLDREIPFLAGDNRTLMIIVRSDTVPTVTWSVNGQQLTSSNSTYMIGSPVAGTVLDRVLTEYTVSLSVYFLNTTYQGEYRVVVEVPSDGLRVERTGNVLQERLTSTVIVEVVDSPCLVAGTNVTLRCQPDGVPRSRVTWFYNVQLLSSNSKYLISDYPEFTLTITNVVSSDAGAYTCRAENTLTNGTASGIVTETFNDFSMACVTPTIPESPDDTMNNNPMLRAGEPLTLTCAATGTPRPEIEWYRGDSMIISSSRIQITNINSDIDDTTVVSTLVISSVTVGDSGTYECRAENMAGTASQEYSVSVAAMPPTIAEATNDTVDSSPMLTAGQVMALTCTAMGIPRPQIDWYDGDGRIITSSRIQINKTEIDDSTLVSTLVISSVTVGDAGTYECRVENDGGSTSLQYQVVVTGDGGDGGRSSSGAAIAGGVVAGSVAILIISAGVVITILTVLCCSRRKPLGSVKSREEGEEMVQATPDYETMYDTIDEYEMASLGSRAEPMRGGGGDSVNPGPEGEQPTTREEEEEEGEKMQTNPAYLPIEISYKSQESKCINVPS